MGEVVGSLARHSRIGIDSPVFIYHIEGLRPWSEIAGQVLRMMAMGQVTGTTSVLALLEITVWPLKLGRLEIADNYEFLIRNIPHLEIVAIDAQIARIAASLRAKHGLATPDALQIGASLAFGATAFVTNDKRLRRVSEIEVVVLDDFV